MHVFVCLALACIVCHRTQLALDEQAALHRYASAIARSASSGNCLDTTYLTQDSAAWALAGRWRLVLAPQEWSWLLGFSPGADVLVDVDTENSTIDYAIHFPNRWQLLQRLQWHARFSLQARAGGNVEMLSFQILRLLAVVAGALKCWSSVVPVLVCRLRVLAHFSFHLSRHTIST